MVGFLRVTDPKYAAFVIGLPNDMTCWDFNRKQVSIVPSEMAHLVMITARARGNMDDAYVNAEIEKGHLEMPERMKQRRAARRGALTRKLREHGLS